MREELDKLLCEKYPKMLVERHADPMETAMCWGFACGDGWFHILDKLMGNIQSHIDWKNKCRQREVDKFIAREQGYDSLLKFYSGGHREPSEWEIKQADETMSDGVTIPPEVPQVVLEQVKEKFGTLRFYYRGGDDEISGMVRMAEAMTEVTCEDCGSVGERRHGGWIRTLCDKHEEEYQTRKATNE